ncbi:sigma-70 family RNA polymerase sigma factor [Novosphingobium sp. EMRT-2]|nr:sigma-70 family RNA polymerase sigma factor [Novosphingobium sp. EMRT-2]
MPEDVMAMVSGMQELEQLLGAVATGDMAAFRGLYDVAAGRLLAIAMKILRDRDAAEDAVQEAFLRIWRKAGSYEAARGSPLAWMSIIARNAALDNVRRRRPAEELEAVDVIDLAVQPVEPPDARLGQCLGRLPADQARAIVTMYTYGLSHVELAEQLSTPLGTVKSWVRRGTRSLKECMES